MTTQVLGITDARREEFATRGFVRIPSFYDADTDLRPIWTGVRDIIELVAAHAGVSIPPGEPTEADFDAGFAELIRADRRFGSVVYDAVKQLAPFVRLVASERHEELLRSLRSTDVVGVAAGGFGIRIDNPDEDRYRAQWHQEYPAQLRSIDGCVFWSPLVNVTTDIGPIEICDGSHAGGLVKVGTRNGGERSGAYALFLEDEERVVGLYPHVSEEIAAGDLVVMDFLTIHRSGANRSHRSRWTMQSRLFNFRHDSGVRIGWAGSFAAGTAIADVHPELLTERPDR